MCYQAQVNQALGKYQWSNGHRVSRHQLTTWEPVTSHRAPVSSLGTGHQTATISFEHQVANYIKGILRSHYQMSLRFLDILNHH